MLRALKLYWKSLGELYYEIVVLGAVNILWALFLIPIVTAPPATVALFYVTNRLVNGEDTKIKDFFTGMRTYFGKAWQVAAISLAITILIVANIMFYSSMGNEIVRLVTILWLYLLVFWIALLMYMLPLLIEQENKSIMLLLKNATILVVDNIGATAIAFLLIIFTLLLNFLLGGIWVFVLFGSFIAMYENRLVINLLEKYRSRTDE